MLLQVGSVSLALQPRKKLVRVDSRTRLHYPPENPVATVQCSFSLRIVFMREIERKKKTWCHI